MTKTCRKCEECKPLGEFHRQGSRGRHSYCKPCYNERYRGKRKRKDPPERKRQHNYKTRYGMSVEDVEAMLESQRGLCAICKQQPQRPCVDHCHRTGVVRGILCHRCNVSLSILEDDDLRKAAMSYLENAA